MAVAATGFFDGVHLGHRKVITEMVSLAASRREESLVVTFWPHPRTVLKQEARSLRLITSMDEKTAMLKSLGVDRVEVIPFTREFGALKMEDYLKDWLVERLGVSTIVLGYDNRMGADCCSPMQVAETASRLGIGVRVSDKADDVDGYTVSSTVIREMIDSGSVETASRMLGYDYMLHGVVVSGNRIGRTLGFPTANMQLYEPLKALPGNGAYFVRVETAGRSCYGMCNVGVRPTLNNGTYRTIETHILDFDEEIYGLDLTVTFLRKLRDEVRFSGLEQLRGQLCLDEASCREIMKSYSK